MKQRTRKQIVLTLDPEVRAKADFLRLKEPYQPSLSRFLESLARERIEAYEREHGPIEVKPDP